jgi:hypothetical protein
MKRITAVLACGLLFNSSAATAQTILFQLDAQGRPTAPTARAPDGVYRGRLNLEALEPGRTLDVVLPLPGDPVRVTLKSLDSKSLNLPKGQAAWYGRPDDRGGGEVFLLRGDGWMIGRVARGGRVYQVRSFGQGVLTVEALTQERAFPQDEPAGWRSGGFRAKPGPAALADCADPANQVDLMVLYTTAAKTGAGGDTQIQAEAAFAVAQTNLSYLNSGVNHRMNLVYTGELVYAQPSPLLFNPMLTDLQSGAIPGVGTLRDTHHADVVTVITEGGDACGLGYYSEPAGPGGAPWAYSVVARSCAGGNLSLAHETGHNLSADHDPTNALAHTTYTYNYGHLQPTAVPPWRTVMSYQNPCGTLAGSPCARLTYFSNPGVSFGGNPTGVAGSADNVMAMNIAGPIASQYRCRTPGVAAAVWMKDTWQDTGLKPDPATASQPMWISPYIWNRNAQDTTLLHQHEHQNPEFGSPNWLYVKAHNDGGTSASGHLELYWASASTNLNNPANWNLISSQAVTIAPGTRVVEFPWPSLPGVGHYCLMARWIEGPVTPLSFADVNTAVRNSNDLVWRNMNIVDLAPDPSPDAAKGGDMIVRGTAQGHGGDWLVISPRVVAGAQVPWAQVGAATATVTVRSPRGGRYPARTYPVTLAGKPVVIGPLPLQPGQEARVSLKFRTDPRAVRAAAQGLEENAVLALDVVQADAAAAKALAAGDRGVFSRPGAVTGGVTWHLTIRSKSGRDPTAHPPKG